VVLLRHFLLRQGSPVGRSFRFPSNVDSPKPRYPRGSYLIDYHLECLGKLCKRNLFFSTTVSFLPVLLTSAPLGLTKYHSLVIPCSSVVVFPNPCIDVSHEQPSFSPTFSHLTTLCFYAFLRWRNFLGFFSVLSTSKARLKETSPHGFFPGPGSLLNREPAMPLMCFLRRFFILFIFVFSPPCKAPVLITSFQTMFWIVVVSPLFFPRAPPTAASLRELVRLLNVISGRFVPFFYCDFPLSQSLSFYEVFFLAHQRSFPILLFLKSSAPHQRFNGDPI